jgi:hypothetical protein
LEALRSGLALRCGTTNRSSAASSRKKLDCLVRGGFLPQRASQVEINAYFENCQKNTIKIESPKSPLSSQEKDSSKK